MSNFSVYEGKLIELSHGSGGKAMNKLIQNVILKILSDDAKPPLEDCATLDLGKYIKDGAQVGFTSDSFVVDPLEFPGGDIGKLAVCGTVNDLAVGGAVPLSLSCSLIIEEGLPIPILIRLLQSMKQEAEKACVKIITGDTKVVPKGGVDKLFINTAGVGYINNKSHVSIQNILPGDKIIINSSIGEHGVSIMAARGELFVESNVESDCKSLHHLIQLVLEKCEGVHAMRDATRGGLATVLNEFAKASSTKIHIYENKIPIKEQVKSFCEILGLDPLYVANEGVVVLVASSRSAEMILSKMKEHLDGKNAAIIGEVEKSEYELVTLHTAFGGERIVDMLVGDQLPRIC